MPWLRAPCDELLLPLAREAWPALTARDGAALAVVLKKIAARLVQRDAEEVEELLADVGPASSKPRALAAAAEELAVEAQHPTAETGPPRWGVFGKSSGGYGALMLPTLFPGRFLAAAAHPPDAAFDVAYPPDFPSAVEAIRQRSATTSRSTSGNAAAARALMRACTLPGPKPIW